MSFDGQVRKGFLKVQKKDLLLSFLIFLLLLSLIYFSQVSSHFLAKLLYFKMSIIAWNVGIQLAVISILFSFCVQTLKCKNVVKLLNLIQNFDMEVSEKETTFNLFLIFFQALQFNIKVDHKKQKKIVQIFTTAPAISPVIVMTMFGSQIIKVENVMNSIFLTLLIGFFGLFTMCFVCQFIISSLALKNRFQALNESFENFSNDEIKFVETKVFESAKFGKLFDKLCDGIEIVNETFTFQFIFLFAQMLVGFIISVWIIENNWDFFKVLLSVCFLWDCSIFSGRKIGIERTRGNKLFFNSILLRHHHISFQSNNNRHQRFRRIEHNKSSWKNKSHRQQNCSSKPIADKPRWKNWVCFNDDANSTAQFESSKLFLHHRLACFVGCKSNLKGLTSSEILFSRFSLRQQRISSSLVNSMRDHHKYLFNKPVKSKNLRQ